MVKIDPRYFRPAEVETLLGDPTKAKQKLGWEATTSFEEMGTAAAEYVLDPKPIHKIVPTKLIVR